MELKKLEQNSQNKYCASSVIENENKNEVNKVSKKSLA